MSVSTEVSYLNKSFQLYKEEVFGKYVFEHVSYHKFYDTSKLSDLYSEGTRAEKYSIDIFIKYDIAFTAIKELKHITQYITLHPLPQHFLKGGIKEIDYYKGQFENFYIRCSSICDFIAHFGKSGQTDPTFPV